jgi:hypothetical protein
MAGGGVASDVGAGSEVRIADAAANSLVAPSRIGCHIGSESLASFSAGDVVGMPTGAGTGVSVAVAAAPDVRWGAAVDMSCATCRSLGDPCCE